MDNGEKLDIIRLSIQYDCYNRLLSLDILTWLEKILVRLYRKLDNKRLQILLQKKILEIRGIKWK